METPLAKEKKPVSQAKIDSMKRAQAIRKEQLRKKREDDEEAKKLIEKAYHAEVEASLTKTMLPKYSKKLKKEILQKLQAQKLLELKAQYGYKSESSSDSSSDSSSEDEVVVVQRKKKSIEKKKTVVINEMKEKPVAKAMSILEKYKEYGF